MNVARSLERMEKFMDLDHRWRAAMLACTGGRADDSLIDELSDLEVGYAALLRDTKADDTLVKADDLRGRLAEVADWRARALETMRRLEEAMPEFERAARLFAEVGKTAESQQSLDKASDVRIELTADFDAEIQRLRARLDSTQPGSVDRVQVLIALGELYGRANDDFESIRFLEQAETELEALGGHPSDRDLVADLGETMRRIGTGEQPGGLPPIATGLQLRVLTRRLLLALANAYRTTDPARAKEYENRLKALDDGKEWDLQDLVGRFLDADQDVGKFLENLSRKR